MTASARWSRAARVASRRRIAVVAGAGALVALGLGAALWNGSPAGKPTPKAKDGFVVVVSNEAPVALTRVVVLVNREKRVVDTIAPGASASVEVPLHGEGDLLVNYTLGDEVCRFQGGYFEPYMLRARLVVRACDGAALDDAFSR